MKSALANTKHMSWEPEIIEAWIEQQGECVDFYVRRNCSDFHGGGRRGPIREFTAAARLRAITHINRLDWGKKGRHTFLSLTYPDEVLPRDKSQRNRDRDNFLGFWERHVGQPATGIWRIEWKPRLTGKYLGRMAPHFHLVLMNTPWVNCELVKDWWRSCLTYRDKYLDTWIEEARGPSGAFYALKYCAKRHPSCSLAISAYLGGGGRHYGYVRKNLLPWCDREIFWGLGSREVSIVCDAVSEEFSWANKDDWKSIRIFGARGQRVVKKLLEFEVAGGRSFGYNVITNGGSGRT